MAAHIKGAAPGSARYDLSQTDEERKHISNGIWMCWNHSVQIDNDGEMYSVDKLLRWKEQRETDAKNEFASTANRPHKPVGLDRPEERLRLDADGKYRANGLVVSYDPWKFGDITMIKLSVGGEIESELQMVPLAVSAVQAYLAGVGLRGQYLHILAQMRNLRLNALTHSFPPEWESQFEQFKERMLGIDWTEIPGMEGQVFDLIAGDVKGTGKWDTFMIDITCLYPDIYSEYMDTNE